VPRKLGALLLGLCFAPGHLATGAANDLKRERIQEFAWMAEELQPMADMVPMGATINYDRGHKAVFPRAWYAPGFFFPGRHVGTSRRVSDFVISKNRAFAEGTLTPENSHLHLFRADAKKTRRPARNQKKGRLGRSTKLRRALGGGSVKGQTKGTQVKASLPKRGPSGTGEDTGSPRHGTIIRSPKRRAGPTLPRE
jgi:hypothetical protein